MDWNPTLPPPNWSDEGTDIGLFDNLDGSGCSLFESIHNSLSSDVDTKPSRFTIETSQDDSVGKKKLPIQEIVETSYAGEPLLPPKLGKRSHIEPIISMEKKNKHNGNDQKTEHCCCQVDGCGRDLSSFKDYYRKHRICQSHSKSPTVVISGSECRFCQQCSRFHSLAEFDNQKRSCRRRLLHHNARRRQTRSKADQLDQSASSSSNSDGSRHTADGSRHTSPIAYSSTAMNLPSQNMTETKDLPFNANIEMPRINPMLSGYPNQYFAPKVIANSNINPDIEDSITSSDLNGRQDRHSALSLLSADSRDSYDTKSIYVEQHSNHTTGSTSQPITSAMSQQQQQHTALPSLGYPQSRDTLASLLAGFNDHLHNFQLPQQLHDHHHFHRMFSWPSPK